MSLHAGDDLSEQGDEVIAEQEARSAEALLKQKGTKAQKRYMAQTERFEQERQMPAAEQVGLESGELKLICTQNGNPLHLGSEGHPAIVEAAREGDTNRITEILDEDARAVNDRRMRKEISERNGYDKEWTWRDDTP